MPNTARHIISDEPTRLPTNHNKMNTVSSPDSASKSLERRSTRLTARPAMPAEASDDYIQVDSDYEQIAESSSRGKKRKTREDKDSKVGPQAKRYRGKRGLLRQLVEMPLDVLFEVGATVLFTMYILMYKSSDIWPP